MIVRAVDVTDEARAAGCKTPGRISSSGGTLGAVDRGDAPRSVRTAAALAARLLQDPALPRLQLTENATMVRLPDGQRFVLVESATDTGEASVSVLTAWEWGLAGSRFAVEVLTRAAPSGGLQ